MIDDERIRGRGRTAIDDNRRSSSYSKRAFKGSLFVVRHHCPFCGHHKALSGGVFKCSRCKRNLG